jgi:hypothetical protein
VLFAIYLYEDFIDVEGIAVAAMLTLQSSGVQIAVAAMLTLQSSGVQGAELDAPKANCFSADGDTPLSQ